MMKFKFFLLYFLIFFNTYSQLPVLDYHNLFETSNEYLLVWTSSFSKSGRWLVEHSPDGLQWQTLKSYENQSNFFSCSISKNLYGFLRLRWSFLRDTTTLIVYSFKQSVHKGIVAYYDYEHCKVTIGYQFPAQTDLLLRFYNSIGEELATHFLFHQENQFHFWNFEPEGLKKDVYLVRLVDALANQVIDDFRLVISYVPSKKKPN